MPSESIYFARRATSSEAASVAATDPAARHSHAQLAARYRRLERDHAMIVQVLA